MSIPQLRFRNQAKLVRKGCVFPPLFSCNFDDQLSSNFHRFVILCISVHQVRWLCLWQLPIESSVFKSRVFFYIFFFYTCLLWGLRTQRKEEMTCVVFDPRDWAELCFILWTDPRVNLIKIGASLYCHHNLKPWSLVYKWPRKHNRLYNFN